MDIHCVVTGQDESGESVIMRNTPIKPVSLALLPGYEFHRIWGSDSIPELRTVLRLHSLATSRLRVVSVSRSSPYHRIRKQALIRST